MSLDKVEHIVHLMLENRSFDSLLGWLYENDIPRNNIPAAIKGDEFRGLHGVNLTDFKNTVDDLGIASPPIRGTIGASVPDIAPGEEMHHVNTQLFDKETVSDTDTPTMKGYMADYRQVLKAAKDDEEIPQLADMVMQSFTPTQLPVLNQLAKHYAVCDDWFSSVPSQTNPNRAFALTGSSHGLVDNGFLETNRNAKQLGALLKMGIGDDRFPEKTLFNVLEENGQKDWKIFWETSMIPEKISNLISKIESVSSLIGHAFPEGAADIEALLKRFKSIIDIPELLEYLTEISSGELTSCYSYRLYEQLRSEIENLETHFAKTEQFHLLAKTGKLPKYSYIEPRWTIAESTVDRGAKRLVTTMGNDYHPPGNLNEAENYVKSIYESLISNQASWDKTLFIITFDEPVGSFDHIKPPAATPPWGNTKPDFDLQENFQFNRYGGRVPAILISPYIEKGTVFRSQDANPFDHASVIKTVLSWANLGEKAEQFGIRVTNAPSFENVLTRQEQRTDAHEIGFLNYQRPLGTELLYGDRFRLKNQNGQYLSEFKRANISDLLVIPNSLESIAFDLSLRQNFPQLSDNMPAALFFQSSDVTDPTVVKNSDVVRIASDEMTLESFNYLGAWKDSHDCYYFNLYLRGENAPKQQWQIQKMDGSDEAIKFGDQVRLVNQFFTNQGLAKDGRLLQGKWITTQENGDYWTIEPVE